MTTTTANEKSEHEANINDNFFFIYLFIALRLYITFFAAFVCVFVRVCLLFVVPCHSFFFPFFVKLSNTVAETFSYSEEVVASLMFSLSSDVSTWNGVTRDFVAKTLLLWSDHYFYILSIAMMRRSHKHTHTHTQNVAHLCALVSILFASPHKVQMNKMN